MLANWIIATITSSEANSTSPCWSRFTFHGNSLQLNWNFRDYLTIARLRLSFESRIRWIIDNSTKHRRTVAGDVRPRMRLHNNTNVNVAFLLDSMETKHFYDLWEFHSTRCYTKNLCHHCWPNSGKSCRQDRLLCYTSGASQFRVN